MYDNDERRPHDGQEPQQPQAGQSRPGFDYGMPPAYHMQLQPLYQTPPPPPPPSPRRSRSWGLAVGAVALVVLGAVSGSASTWYLSRKFGSTPQTFTLSAPSPARNVVLQGESAAIPDVYKRVGPAVVRIESTSTAGQGLQLGPFGFRMVPQQQKGVGSGFVFDARGYILTNNHVIAGAQQLNVIFEDGATYPATVVGKGAADDLAVIKIDPGNRQLTVAPLGDSDQVQIGEPAIAIGAPFELDHTVTSGIISGRNRPIQTNQGSSLTGLLQTDAAVNPGNSGGPLLDAAGNVIGINTAIESNTGSNVGIGFAIPINRVKNLLPALLAGKAPQRPAIGIYGLPVSDSGLARIRNKPDHGVAVVNVVADSAADKAGLQGATLDNRQNVVRLGDVITSIDGKPVQDLNGLQDYLAGKQVGDKVTLEVWNNGKTRSVTVTLGPAPQPDTQDQGN